MKARLFAKIFGLVFLLIGVLGFVPSLAQDKLLLGLLEVGFVHNLIHIVSGVFALLAASSDVRSRMFFKVLGAVYAVTTIIGFVMGGSVLGIFHVNMADNLLHLVIGLAAFAIGFSGKPSAMPETMDSVETPKKKS